MKNKIKFQLEELKLNSKKAQSNFQDLRIKAVVNGGVEEHLRVEFNDIILDCTMQWETGSYYYDVNLNFINDLLSKKPFTEITS